MCWVKWEDVCKPKKDAGLGIRDLRLANLSLLAKWRWKLLSHDHEMWKMVIAAKYGSACIGAGNLGVLHIPSLASTWWRDICSLDLGSNWFVEAVEKRVGDGNLTLFWHDIWVGDRSLHLRFPRIFGISSQKTSTIASLGRWDDGMWRWEFIWRRTFFEWEIPIYEEFFNFISQFVPSLHGDKWLWSANPEDGFSVSDCYKILYQKLREPCALDWGSGYAFSNIWNCGVPSKVSAFSWQLFLDRIPTKENLRKRRILLHHQSVCVFCGADVETSVHLFLHCSCATKVWYDLMKWLGFVIIVPPDLVSSFGVLLASGKGKRGKVCLNIIWNSFVWSIWKFRNEFVFNNKVIIVDELVDHIKFQAWKWFIGRVAKSPCMLYEWLWSPLDCFSR
jgi:hypothetical protein